MAPNTKFPSYGGLRLPGAQNKTQAQTQARVFPKFRKLAPEIRAIIWNLAKPGRRVVFVGLEVSALDDESEERSQVYIHTRTKIPAILHVCRESRAIALHSYTQIFPTRDFVQEADACGDSLICGWEGVYFDLSRDTLYFDDLPRTGMFHPQGRHGCKLHLVERLAMPFNRSLITSDPRHNAVFRLVLGLANMQALQTLTIVTAEATFLSAVCRASEEDVEHLVANAPPKANPVLVDRVTKGLNHWRGKLNGVLDPTLVIRNIDREDCNQLMKKTIANAHKLARKLKSNSS